MWVTRENVLESVTIGQPVCNAEPDRVAVFIVNMGTVGIHLRTTPPPYGSTAGFPVHADSEIDFHWSRDGDLARQELRCVDPTAPQEIYVLEVLYWPTAEHDNG